MQGLRLSPYADSSGLSETSLRDALLNDFYLLRVNINSDPIPPFFPAFKEPSGTTKNKQASKIPEQILPELLDAPVRTTATTARILLADDHETVRRGVRAILATRKDYELVDVSNGADAVIEAHRKAPDLVILDLTMPALDGFTAAQEIRKFLPTVPILFFSMHQQTDALLSLAKARNVQGFVCKTEPGSVLLQDVEALLAKKEFFPAASQVSSDANSAG